MRGRKTEPAKEEAVYAYYVLHQSYAVTAQHFGMPFTTVVDVVDRLKTDSVARVRNAKRADLAMKCWDKAAKMIDRMNPELLGTEHTSSTADAGQALDRLSRAGALFEPTNVETITPTDIHVHLDMAPPPELISPTTDTTLTATAKRGDDPAQ